MASTNRPLDESTATLVAPDDHLHAKNLLSTPTNISTAISSGTVSDEEPSTPEPLSGVPVSVLCGWPHSGSPNGKAGLEGTTESGWPHEDDPKDATAKDPKGRPDDGSGGWPRPGDSDKPDPAKWHTLKGTSNDGTDSTSKDDSASVLCGWPHADGPNGKPGHEMTKESGWPHEDDPKDAAARYSEGQPSVGGVHDNGSGDWPNPGDSSKDDPAKGWPDGNASKPDPAKLHTLNGTSNEGTDTLSQDDSVSVLCGWPHVNGPEDSAAKIPNGRPLVGGVPGNGDMPNPGDPSKNDPAKIQPDSGNDQTQPEETAGPERRRKPGTVGPEGQPPWGVKNLAATAANATSLEGPEGQPPWGIKNLGTAVNATGGVAGPEGQPPWGIKKLGAAIIAKADVASPEGQPPWGIKNLGAAVNAKADVAGPEGQPPWGVKNLAASDGGPEGQPPWGTKGRAAAATATTGGNESGKGDDGAQDA
ncbi:hypothetical protein BBO_05996 [Beauveria brongniartii RCEF 3172]|uniref:Uncharacterized protein n=1 Tax=Beauveria brongniartii RCEF 3172 TaxID=1081107 RepID=A0A167BU52_9HYPO|nr:hypothetical protein BBO_05996 [Beauveria brongniartii RCEF 3172]